MRRTFILLIAIILIADVSYGWGFRSHRNIHSAAIAGMPDEIRPFFETHSEYLIEESVRPDLRRRHDPTEGPNHYINLDRFGDYPFPDFPLRYDDAVEIYGKDTLISYGLAIWRVENWFDSLTVAMAEQDTERILLFAADIGHYIADLHMPLHTTSNYDGQLTGQRGVHRRFETDLPERYDTLYSWEIPGVTKVENPLDWIFNITLESYRFVDAVYEADLIGRKGIPEGELYTIERRNNRNFYVYNEIYFKQFHNALNGMVEERLQLSAKRIRDIWYSAWVKAGKPDLT